MSDETTRYEFNEIVHAMMQSYLGLWTESTGKLRDSFAVAAMTLIADNDLTDEERYETIRRTFLPSIQHVLNYTSNGDREAREAVVEFVRDVGDNEDIFPTGLYMNVLNRY